MKTGDVWASRSFTATGNGFACNDGSTGTSVESYAICASSSIATNSTGEQWEAYTDPVYSNYIRLTKLPITPTVVPG